MGNEIGNLLDALARNPLARIALAVFALALATTFLIGIVQNIYRWGDAAPPPLIASVDVWKLGMVIGSAGTATALLITLYVADRNYRRSREHIPSLTLTLEIYRVPASAQYDAVIAILNAQNTGTGLCRVNGVHWVIRALSSYDDKIIAELSREFAVASNSVMEPAFPWHELDAFATPLDLSIEPNQKAQMSHDFIIDTGITAFDVSARVDNAGQPGTEWYCRAIQIY